MRRKRKRAKFDLSERVYIAGNNISEKIFLALCSIREKAAAPHNFL